MSPAARPVPSSCFPTPKLPGTVLAADTLPALTGMPRMGSRAAPSPCPAALEPPPALRVPQPRDGCPVPTQAASPPGPRCEHIQVPGGRKHPRCSRLALRAAGPLRSTAGAGIAARPRQRARGGGRVGSRRGAGQGGRGEHRVLPWVAALQLWASLVGDTQEGLGVALDSAGSGVGWVKGGRGVLAAGPWSRLFG